MIFENDSSSIILCNEQLERVKVMVRATMDFGKLTVSGQDIGPLCEELFGDSDYEYAYIFDEENTFKLLDSLKPLAEAANEKSLMSTFIRLFSGVDGCMALREYCEENEIQYRFWNYM